MLDDPAFKKLLSSAKVLYLYMKMWACGQDTIKYAASMAKDFMSSKTFIKARNELVDKGFIDWPNRHRSQDKGEVAEYEFSSRWSKQPFTGFKANLRE